jgi:hypothetical protein
MSIVRSIGDAGNLLRRSVSRPQNPFLGVILISYLICGTSIALATGAGTGQAVYQQDCAKCHGPMGEGTKKTSRPLVGEKSPSQLSSLISRTMPDDDPGSCTDAEYRQVSSYIYDTFYSTDAQARLHPPRVELSHLTVGQYRSVVADLIGGFRSGAKLDGRHGLRGEYFNSPDTRNDKRLIDRVDPVVNFDFGTEGPRLGDLKLDNPKSDGPATKPAGEQFNPNQFCMRWTGSVFASETGTYEFVVHTEHALQLWVNDLKKPVVDGMVKSGSDTEYRASIFLIAGRSYSIRLQVFKGLQIKDRKGGAPVPTKASVALLWQVPGHQADDLIPSRSLSPVQMPEVAVMQSAFPPDDRSLGWERGTSVSKEWVAATTDAALEVASYVTSRLAELAGTDGGPDRNAKLRQFCKVFAERAFGRPLTDAETRQFFDQQFEAGSDLELAVKRVVIRVMISPEFLYRGSIGGSDGYAVASRLALTLWDSLPDRSLLSAAADGRLSTPGQIADQATRMLDDPRARLKVRQFLLAWLRVDQSPELVKDKMKFPEFDAPLASDLRTSMELFLDDVVSSETADYRQLLLSDDLFLNGRLAKFYGIDLPADADFTKVKLDSGERAGVLTQPYMLATYAYPGESSPIHRGVFIIRGILGVTLRPPANAAFTPLAPSSHPDLTTRERISLQTSPDSCVACHAVINPLGFALEKFDSVGRYREMENAKPIDAGGHYETRAGPDVKFAGARELAAYLAGSEEAHDAFAQQMFQQMVKQPVRAYGLGKPAELRQMFAQSGYNIRKLLVDIAVIASHPS